MTGSSQNHQLLDALREKAEAHPELQALIYNVQHGMHKRREVPLPQDSLRSLGLILLGGARERPCLLSPYSDGGLSTSFLLSLPPSENGYASTDEEVSEFSEGR